jgi:hypothetical protein
MGGIQYPPVLLKLMKAKGFASKTASVDLFIAEADGDLKANGFHEIVKTNPDEAKWFISH